jgi:HPr Serine kinase C-terminal domain
VGAVVDNPVYNGELPGGVGWLTASTETASVRINDVARFELDHGQVLRTEPEPGADPLSVEVWRHGLVTVLALAQTGVIALHATSVEIGGLVVALAGQPGAGKSTTALELSRRGHRLVADDVSPLSTEGRFGVTLTPTGRPLHVWPEAAKAVGLDVPEDLAMIPGTSKLILPTPHAEPVAVDAIIILTVGDDQGQLAWEQLPPADAVPRLAALVHCGSVVRCIWPEQVFMWAASLAAAVPVFLVIRPGSGRTIGEVAELVERLTGELSCG